MKKIISTMIAILMAAAMILTVAAAETTAIDAQEALSIVLEDAGVESSDALSVTVKQEVEHEQTVYDVEFTSGVNDYDYLVSAADGSIIKRSYEPTAAQEIALAQAQEEGDALVTEDEAKEIALTNAGLTEDEVTFAATELDVDDGVRVYEITFYTDSAEYEYDVDIMSGEIHAMSQEIFSAAEPTRPGDRLASAADSAATGIEAAKETALADAGLTADQVTFTKAKLERDDGIAVYEIEFVTDSAEYDYEINASTGAIIGREMESFTAASDTSSDAISVDEAKEIAAVHAGYTVDQVTFTKAKLERDDGIQMYEIEFIVDGMEYEYEIRASNGTILEYESEKAD